MKKQNKLRVSFDFDDTKQTKEDKIKLIKTLDRTISDMESDGMYFSEEVREGKRRIIL